MFVLNSVRVAVLAALSAQALADVPVGGRVLSLQSAALDQLMSYAVALRLLDSQEKVENRKQALGLPELYVTVQDSVWSELISGKDIGDVRRAGA